MKNFNFKNKPRKYTLLGYESRFLNFFLSRHCLKTIFYLGTYLKKGTIALTDINKHPSKIRLFNFN